MENLKIHCFQHVDFEDLGCIKTWSEDKGFQVSYTKFFESHFIPEADSYDLLIVLGGPMGANDELQYPWLQSEKLAIKNSIDKSKKVLGICLGSQLIASVLGAKVYKNQQKEIGWFDITLTENKKIRNFLNSDLTSFKVFHWHGDTFELPVGTIHLAFSNACKNQAFTYKDNVLGLQFHLEATAINIKAMIENGRNDLIKEAYIQSEDEILSQKNFIQFNNQMMFNILDELCSKN